MKLLKKIINKITFPFKTKNIVLVTDKYDFYISIPFFGKIVLKEVKLNSTIKGYHSKEVFFDEFC
jgi:hypothetical protein